MKSLLLLLVLCGVPATHAAAVPAAPESDLPAKAHNESQPPVSVSEDAPQPRSGERFLACPPRWVGYKRNCYLLVSTYYSWASAQALCDSYRATLPSAHSVADRNFLQELTRRSGYTQAWIGGFYFSGWKWLDNTRFTYNGWYSQSSASNACIYINTVGGWSNANCASAIPSICVISRDGC